MEPAVKARRDSAIEAMFALHLRACQFPPWVRNHVFYPGRKFELDFAWPDRKFAVEVDGEVHRIKERFHADVEKHALAFLSGWAVLRVDGRSIRNGAAVQWAAQHLQVSLA